MVSDLWKKRLKLCQARKINENEVEEHNKKIAASLREILLPVAKRTEMPISVEVFEKCTKVHVDFTYLTRTENFNPRVTMSYPSVYEILLNKKNIDKHIKKIESQIRFLKKAVGKTEVIKCSSTLDQRNKLLVNRPGCVFVTFSTRTRYF